VWRLNPKSSLHYRHWGNEWVVFDVGSGQTHEMDTVAAATLMHCENGWISLTDLVTGVTADLELEIGDALAATLLPLLNHFAAREMLEYRAQ